MAAYAAVISLSHTIDGLLKLPLFFHSPSIRKLFEFAFDRADYLQQLLHRLNGKAEIRDCAHRLEDVLQLHELHPQDEEVRQEISFFVERVKNMEKDYIEEEEDDEDEDEAETSGVPSDTGLVVEMVGVSGLFDTVQDLRYSLDLSRARGGRKEDCREL